MCVCAFSGLFFFSTMCVSSSLLRSFAHFYLYSRLRFIYCSVVFIFGFAYIICAKLNRFFFLFAVHLQVCERVCNIFWLFVDLIISFTSFAELMFFSLSHCVCVYAFVCAVFSPFCFCLFHLCSLCVELRISH